MKTYVVNYDVCASLTVRIQAESIEAAERQAEQMIKDEDEFFKQYEHDVCLWDPEIDEVFEAQDDALRR